MDPAAIDSFEYETGGDNDPAIAIPPADQHSGAARILYLQHASDPIVWLTEPPPSRGHAYTLEFVDGWAQILQPAGWTTRQADNLRTLIAQLPD
jgi:uncharacterized membrane protein